MKLYEIAAFSGGFRLNQALKSLEKPLVATFQMPRDAGSARDSGGDAFPTSLGAKVSGLS